MHKRPARSANGERPAKAGRLIMRHTLAEREAWQRRASECNMTLSEFLRSAANSFSGIAAAPRKKPERASDDPTKYALLKIGNNINQQTHAINTLLLAGETPDPQLAQSILRTHAELSAILANIRSLSPA